MASLRLVVLNPIRSRDLFPPPPPFRKAHIHTQHNPLSSVWARGLAEPPCYKTEPLRNDISKRLSQEGKGGIHHEARLMLQASLPSWQRRERDTARKPCIQGQKRHIKKTFRSRGIEPFAQLHNRLALTAEPQYSARMPDQVISLKKKMTLSSSSVEYSGKII